MKLARLVVAGGIVLVCAAFIVGCSKSSKPAAAAVKMNASAPADGSEGASDISKEEEDIIRDSLGKLSEADRKLAEVQKVCPVSLGRLGLMGAPVKVRLKDQDVFLCCSGCRRELESDPDKYLSILAAIKKDPDKYLAEHPQAK